MGGQGGRLHACMAGKPARAALLSHTQLCAPAVPRPHHTLAHTRLPAVLQKLLADVGLVAGARAARKPALDRVLDLLGGRPHQLERRHAQRLCGGGTGHRRRGAAAAQREHSMRLAVRAQSQPAKQAAQVHARPWLTAAGATGALGQAHSELVLQPAAEAKTDGGGMAHSETCPTAASATLTLAVLHDRRRTHQGLERLPSELYCATRGVFLKAAGNGGSSASRRRRRRWPHRSMAPPVW